MSEKQHAREQWSSHWIFIMATAGSAVGLGNIWRFPYIVGEYGGGAFVLIYIACVLLVGVPIMIAEIALGRCGRLSPCNSLATISRKAGLNTAWQGIGWLGMAAGFLILSFYSVIAGWTIEYILQASTGKFTGATSDKISANFQGLLADPGRMLIMHTLFMILTAAVISMGVRRGLERAIKFLMPALFLLLLIMMIYSMSTKGFSKGLHYLFHPDWNNLSAEGFLAALGQAFFSLSIGMGAIMAYGSYLKDNDSIVKTASSVALVDTLVAIIAGLAIFPLIFTYSLEPGGGPGLIFITLPIAFAQMPYGQILGTSFFVLLMFAAWTSSISLIEPTVIWLIERFKISRVKATLIVGALSWILGIGSVLSFNLWQNHQLFGKTYFDIMDYVTSNIMLPTGGLLIAIFVAWRMPKDILTRQLGGDSTIFRLWLAALGYIAPLGALLIFIHVVGLL